VVRPFDLEIAIKFGVVVPESFMERKNRGDEERFAPKSVSSEVVKGEVAILF
jgi:hypothetical protein